MKKAAIVVALVVACSLAAFAQKEPVTNIGGALNKYLAGAEGEFVPAAEAMPEDKFDFAPTSGEFKGVRTFAQQVRHVAAVNYMIGAAILGEKPPVALKGEDAPDTVKTKADTIKFLKDSFVYAHKAFASINEKNAYEQIPLPWGPQKTERITLALIMAGHPWDHYGQMVEYLRMNGIIPPASRGQ